MPTAKYPQVKVQLNDLMLKGFSTGNMLKAEYRVMKALIQQVPDFRANGLADFRNDIDKADYQNWMTIFENWVTIINDDL